MPARTNSTVINTTQANVESSVSLTLGELTNIGEKFQGYAEDTVLKMSMRIPYVIKSKLN